MINKYERTLEDLIEVLKRASKENTRVNLLIGAGASVTGNVPLADTIIQDIKRKFPREYEKAENKTYAECMSTLTSLERRRLISDYVVNAKVNWAHLLIAHLMKNKVINSVLTTNFDNLLIRACALENSIPGVYDLAAANSFRPELLYENSIIYLHGQYTGFVLCNTESELEEQKDKIEPTFVELNKNSMWIVVGYSGENDPIVKLFKKHKNSDNRLYWIGYEESEPNNDVKELLESKDKHCYYIKGYNADSFFVDLCRGLEKYPPDIINAPFTHLYNTIDMITEYIEEDIPFINNESYNNMTKEIVKKAINDYEHNNVIMAEYYYRLNLIKKFKAVREKASDEERIDIDKISKKYKIKELTTGALRYLDELINKEVKFNIKNLELANIAITFLEDSEREKALEKIDKILVDCVDDDESIVELKISVLSSLYSYKQSTSFLDRILNIIEESNIKEYDIKGYLIIKMNVFRKLGKYYINTEKELSLDYFDKALNIIEENEEILSEICFEVIKGEIYIHKIECSERTYRYIGLVLDSFNKAINEYSNDKIDIDDKFRLISFINAMYRLAINSLQVDSFSELIFDEMNSKMKSSSSINIILSYLESVNIVINEVEEAVECEKFLDNVFNIIKEFDLTNIEEKEVYDISIQINQLAYLLIDIKEKKYSKLFLDLSKDKNENSFNIATEGFYELRINNNLNLGIEYYDKAIDKEESTKLKLAIEQKKLIEVTKYNIKFNKNDEAISTINKALSLGVISKGWSDLYNEALNIKDSLEQNLENDGICIKEIALDKNEIKE